MKENKKPNKIIKGKKPNFKLSMQDIVIIILLISYLFIFYAYNHDIEQIQNVTQQYKDIVENPQKLCYQYYEYLNYQQVNKEEVSQNLSELFNGLIVNG